MNRNKKIISIVAAIFLIIISFTFYDVVVKSDFIEVFVFNSNTTPEPTTKPTPTPEPTIKPAETVKFIGVGDNLIHGMIYMQAAERASSNEYNFDYAYKNIENYFDDFDIKFINQETLVNDVFKPSTYPQFSSPVELGEKDAYEPICRHCFNKAREEEGRENS